MASATRIVLHHWIALWKPKSELEAIKHAYYYTVNPKFAWKCRALHNWSQKGYSTHSAPTKQIRTRCTSTGNTKSILENNWQLASHYIKPNSPQKTPCFGKISTKKVLLVVWTKLNFGCTALQKPESKLKAMKDSNSLLNGENASMSENAFLLQLYIERLF